MTMDKLTRSTTVVTRLVITLIVFSVELVVSQESSTSPYEDNYKTVPCTFEVNFCGWNATSHSTPWTIQRNCEKEKGFWLWKKCTEEVHYATLNMETMDTHTNGTLISPPLNPRSNDKCVLRFLYRVNCVSNACQLSVEHKTDTGVTSLWNDTHKSNDRKTAGVSIPCSDETYQILIVGKKLASEGCNNLDVDNIEYTISTVPSTTEGSTFSSLSRVVSLTSLFTYRDTTSYQASTSQKPNIEPRAPSDKQNSNDEGLGTGPMVAIVIVIVIVLVVVAVTIVIIIRRRNVAEKTKRSSGQGGSTTPGVSNVGGIDGHDNLVYSANRLEMDTIPPMSGNAANTDNTSDYYNVSGQNSSATGPSEPSQDNLYENTRTAPPAEEYAVVDKKGPKKNDLQPEDEYALPNKDQQKKTREKQAGQGQQKNDIPTENKKKKERKPDQQANQSALNSNAAGRSTQAEKATAGVTSDYEPVKADSGMASSRPELPSDMYNNLGDKGRAGTLLDHPQAHYDHISAPDGDYSGMDLEDKIRDQQREAVADEYSHI